MSKRVQENLQTLNEKTPDRYTVKSVSNSGLKMVLQRTDSGEPDL
jgi:hypothetical protein